MRILSQKWIKNSEKILKQLFTRATSTVKKTTLSDHNKHVLKMFKTTRWLTESNFPGISPTFKKCSKFFYFRMFYNPLILSMSDISRKR